LGKREFEENAWDNAVAQFTHTFAQVDESRRLRYFVDAYYRLLRAAPSKSQGLFFNGLKNNLCENSE